MTFRNDLNEIDGSDKFPRDAVDFSDLETDLSTVQTVNTAPLRNFYQPGPAKRSYCAPVARTAPETTSDAAIAGSLKGHIDAGHIPAKDLAFAQSLFAGFLRYSSFTERQRPHVERLIVAATAPKAPESVPAAVSQAVQGLDLSKVPAGRYAVPGGDMRLKILINKPKSGNWAGFVFVSDAAEYGQRQKYGSQRPGGSYRGAIETQLRAIVADPKAAAIAYGRLTGSCCICGRMLEDEVSVARGLGPVCAEKFG